MCERKQCEWCGSMMNEATVERTDQITGKTFFLCSVKCERSFDAYEPQVISFKPRTPYILDDEPANLWDTIERLCEEQQPAMLIGGAAM